MTDGRDSGEQGSGEQEPSKPLPPRDPQPFLVHWAVATAVIFLASVMLCWFILGVPLAAVAIGSAVVGLAVAPYTIGAEERALAQRRTDAEESEEDNPGDFPLS